MKFFRILKNFKKFIKTFVLNFQIFSNCLLQYMGVPCIGHRWDEKVPLLELLESLTRRARDREQAETIAERKTRRGQSKRRDESRAEEAAAVAEAEPKPEADAKTEEERRRSRAKPAEFRAMNVKCASRNLLERSAAIQYRERSKRAWKQLPHARQGRG